MRTPLPGREGQLAGDGCRGLSRVEGGSRVSGRGEQVGIDPADAPGRVVWGLEESEDLVVLGDVGLGLEAEKDLAPAGQAAAGALAVSSPAAPPGAP